MLLPRDRGLLYPRTLPALTSIEGVGNEGLHKTTPGSDTYIKPDILFCSAKMFSCKFYVQGLPFDVKSREIHNLATRFDGCVGSYLSHCNGSPVGVLEFANFDAARHAAAALHNYPFDRDNQQYISVHFPDYYPSGTNVLEHNTLGVQRMWGGETHRRQMDTREDIAPAHEKRKILIKHLDIDTNEVNHPRSHPPPALSSPSTTTSDNSRSW